jgi:hypothetical protein
MSLRRRSATAYGSAEDCLALKGEIQELLRPSRTVATPTIIW